MAYQCAEKRWQQILEITACGAGDLARQKRHGVLVQVKQATQLVEIGHCFGRRILDGDLLTQREDRQTRRAATSDADQFHHVVQQALIVTGAFCRNQDAGQPMVRGGDDSSLVGACCRQDIEAVALQFGSDAAHSLTGNGVGLYVTVNDEDGEFQVFVHAHSLRTIHLQGRSVRSKGTAH